MFGFSLILPASLQSLACKKGADLMLNKFADAHVWDSRGGFTATVAKCHLARFSASDPTLINDIILGGPQIKAPKL